MTFIIPALSRDGICPSRRSPLYHNTRYRDDLFNETTINIIVQTFVVLSSYTLGSQTYPDKKEELRDVFTLLTRINRGPNVLRFFVATSLHPFFSLRYRRKSQSTISSPNHAPFINRQPVHPSPWNSTPEAFQFSPTLNRAVYNSLNYKQRIQVRRNGGVQGIVNQACLSFSLLIPCLPR